MSWKTRKRSTLSSLSAYRFGLSALVFRVSRRGSCLRHVSMPSMIRFRSGVLYVRRSSIASGVNLISNLPRIHCTNQRRTR